MKSETINTAQKTEISDLLGTADIRLVQGADEHLQLLRLMTGIASILAK